MGRQLVQGNEAVAVGALHAGLEYYGGYPITPASEILHYLAKQPDARVVQFEDEISSIMAVIGASLAGAKAMTATSGPGFSLMQEAIGYAHMAEVPLVIVNVQRVGPATGMPTLPAQGDLLQAAYGSHGDYFPIVFYPNSVQELYEYTIRAFNAAEESRSPVILLSDGYLGHLYETATLTSSTPIRARKSPRLGEGGRHYTGLTAWDNTPAPQSPEIHRKLIHRLAAKQTKVGAKYADYEYLPNPRSDTLVVCFGSLSRAILPLADQYAIYRPILMYPAIEALEDVALLYDKIIVAEMNAGQYVKVVQRIVHRDVLSLPLIGGDLDVAHLGKRLRALRNEVARGS